MRRKGVRAVVPTDPEKRQEKKGAGTKCQPLARSRALRALSALPLPPGPPGGEPAVVWRSALSGAPVFRGLRKGFRAPFTPSSSFTVHLRTTNASEQVLFQGWNMWKVYFSDFTGGIHTDLRILPVDFTGGIQGEAFVDLRWKLSGLFSAALC